MAPTCCHLACLPSVAAVAACCQSARLQQVAIAVTVAMLPPTICCHMNSRMQKHHPTWQLLVVRQTAVQHPQQTNPCPMHRSHCWCPWAAAAAGHAIVVAAGAAAAVVAAVGCCAHRGLQAAPARLSTLWGHKTVQTERVHLRATAAVPAVDQLVAYKVQARHTIMCLIESLGKEPNSGSGLSCLACVSCMLRCSARAVLTT